MNCQRNVYSVVFHLLNLEKEVKVEKAKKYEEEKSEHDFENEMMKIEEDKDFEEVKKEIEKKVKINELRNNEKSLQKMTTRIDVNKKKKDSSNYNVQEKKRFSLILQSLLHWTSSQNSKPQKYSNIFSSQTSSFVNEQAESIKRIMSIPEGQDQFIDFLLSKKMATRSIFWLKKENIYTVLNSQEEKNKRFHDFVSSFLKDERNDQKFEFRLKEVFEKKFENMESNHEHVSEQQDENFDKKDFVNEKIFDEKEKTEELKPAQEISKSSNQDDRSKTEKKVNFKNVEILCENQKTVLKFDVNESQKSYNNPINIDDQYHQSISMLTISDVLISFIKSHFFKRFIDKISEETKSEFLKSGRNHFDKKIEKAANLRKISKYKNESLFKLGRSLSLDVSKLSKKTKHSLSSSKVNITTWLERFINICDSLPHCILISEYKMEHDGDVQIIYANPCLCEMTGFSTEDFMYKNFSFLEGKGNFPFFNEKIKNALRTQSHLKTPILHYKKDGTSFVDFFYLNPIFDEHEKCLFYVGLLFDATQFTKEQAISFGKILELLPSKIHFGNEKDSSLKFIN